MLRFILCLSLCAAVIFGQVHTTHNVILKGDSCKWWCQLQKTFEVDFELVDNFNNTLTANQNLYYQTGETFFYGLYLGDDATFDMSYSLTCKCMAPRLLDHPFCTFFIAAKSPANPLIFSTSSNENVMSCDWVSTGSGENYTAIYTAK